MDCGSQFRFMKSRDTVTRARGEAAADCMTVPGGAVTGNWSPGVNLGI